MTLPIKTSPDKLKAYVPKGTFIDMTQWSVEKMHHHLRSLKFVGSTSVAAMKELRRLARNGPLAADCVLLTGTPPFPEVQSKLEWLASPRDLCQPGEPFLRIHPPFAAVDGIDVYGNNIAAASPDVPPELKLNLAPEFQLQTGGFISAEKGGQVRLNDNSLLYSDTYMMADGRQIEFQDVVFQCNVLVKADIVSGTKWKVIGNLTVEGNLSTHEIEVTGNVNISGGIQTNSESPLCFQGNCSVNYVQLSRLGVTGDLKVQNSILQSEIRVGNNLICNSGPGAIMASTVHVFGTLQAKKVGSDQGKDTTIQLHRNNQIGHSNIQFLLAGTAMNVYSHAYVVSEDTAFTSPSLEEVV